jgi:hypothetical protein
VSRSWPAGRRREPGWFLARSKAGSLRKLTLAAGVLLIVVGTVWILQGLDVLKGSFMTGQAFWAWMGAVAVLVGMPLILRGMRRS